MQNPELQMFNVGGLIHYLNSSLRDPSHNIELGDFENSNISVLSKLRNKMEKRTLITARTYPLIYTGDGRGIDGIYNYDSETRIGHISLETGFLRWDGNDGERYEGVEFQTNYPIQLKDGIEIPRCRVNVVKIARERQKPAQDRRDDVRYGFTKFGFWV